MFVNFEKSTEPYMKDFHEAYLTVLALPVLLSWMCLIPFTALAMFPVIAVMAEKIGLVTAYMSEGESITNIAVLYIVACCPAVLDWCLGKDTDMWVLDEEWAGLAFKQLVVVVLLLVFGSFVYYRVWM